MKIIGMRIFILVITFAMVTSQTAGQETLSNAPEQQLFESGMEAYSLQAYSAADEYMTEYISLAGQPRAEAYYYQAVSRLHTGSSQGVALVEAFINREPVHPLSSNGNFVLGTHFFDQGEFEKSLDYFDRTDGSQLTVSEQEALSFKRGYAHLYVGNTEAAETELEAVLNYRGAYFEKASYYLGSIYFENEAYNQALAVLESLDAQAGDYQDDVIRMIAGIYFHTRQYSRLFSYVESHLDERVNDKNKELNWLAGEAHFKEEQYPQAAKYLQRYVDLSRNRASAEVFFKLGYAYFQTNANQAAIENFKKSGLEKGSLGQVSSFYLGQLYLKEKNLNYALSAFKTVMNGNDNEEMIEESAFLTGKINFQNGQYSGAVNDLSLFISQYPNSRWKAKANELLAQAYLRTSDYDQAITHLETIRNKSSALKRAYQKVTFQRGQLLFNDSRFSQSIIYLDKSLAFPIQRSLTAHAYYLKGEAHALLNQPGKAKPAFQEAINLREDPWDTRARYGLGYLHYNEKSFVLAETYFKAYLTRSTSSDPFYYDAQLRLADCYYVQKKYDLAIRTYGLLDQDDTRAYVNYQKGLVYRLLGDLRMAKVSFEKVVTDRASGLGDNALFQLAELQIEGAKFSDALSILDRLLNDYPQSNLVPYAISRQALCYFNAGKYQQARQSYEFILSNYLSHEVANSALLGLQEVIKKGVDVPDFQQYMSKYEQANPNDGSLEVVAFEDAKASYYNQQYEQAITKLEAFMTKYPESGFDQDAGYFLADAHYRSGSWQSAADLFHDLIRSQNTAYMSRALDKRGKALLHLGNDQEAIANYRFFSQNAINQKDQYLAREGLMQTYFQADQLDSALYFANEILKNDWKPVNAENAIWLLKGKIFLKNENYPAALDELIRVVNDSKNENGAEAKYLMGKVYFIQGHHRRSLELLFDLNRNYGSYPYWVGKSFLLVADNYLAMDELLQARATVESIIANAKAEEIIAEAQDKLNRIKKEEEALLVQDTTQTDSIK